MKIEVPKLMDYSGAINANQSMSNAFKQLGDTSQDYLDFSEKKKQNVVDNQYKQDVFNETKNQNNFSNQFRTNEFDYTKIRDDVKDGQYNQQFEYKQGRDLIDDGYKNKVFDYGVKRDGVKDSQWGQEFGYRQGQDAVNNNYKNKVFDYGVSQDNVRNSQWNQTFNNTVANQNKPDYSTFNGVDAQGNPILNMIDKNTGKIINTGQQVYQAPKEISPEQKLYYMDRSNEMQQKTLASTKKTFMESPAYSKMNEQDQLKAIEYIDTNGKAPQISFDDSWLGNTWLGKGYYMPMSDAVQEVKKTNNTKKDGSTIDPFN